MKGNIVNLMILIIGSIILSALFLTFFLNTKENIILSSKIQQSKYMFNDFYTLVENYCLYGYAHGRINTYGDIIWNGTSLCTNKYVHICKTVCNHDLFMANFPDGGTYIVNINETNITIIPEVKS